MTPLCKKENIDRGRGDQVNSSGRLLIIQYAYVKCYLAFEKNGFRLYCLTRSRHSFIWRHDNGTVWTTVGMKPRGLGDIFDFTLCMVWVKLKQKKIDSVTFQASLAKKNHVTFRTTIGLDHFRYRTDRADILRGARSFNLLFENSYYVSLDYICTSLFSFFFCLLP